ncbi:MAG: hypothetical protein ACK6BN_20010, partial [Pseudanabaena sp.]
FSNKKKLFWVPPPPPPPKLIFWFGFVLANFFFCYMYRSMHRSILKARQSRAFKISLLGLSN